MIAQHKSTLGMLVLALMILLVFVPATGLAATCKNQGLTCVSPGGLPQPAATSGTVKTILGIVFGLVGAISLLMITISGLRYVTSGGDPQRAAKAKEGIIFALVGLAVALAAEAIVAFVVNRI